MHHRSPRRPVERAAPATEETPRPAEPGVLDLDTVDDESLVAVLVDLAASPRPAGRQPPPVERAAVRALLEAFGGLAGLARANDDEIVIHLRERRVVELSVATDGVLDDASDDDVRRRARLLAGAFELGRRAALARAAPPARLRDSRDAAAWGMARLGALEHEELWLLAVDGRSRLRGVRRVAQGGIHGASVRAADPLRHALRMAASGFVLVHNHPSGDPTPSPEDVAFTRAVATAAVTVGVPLLDHLVVTADGFASVTPGALA